MLGHLHSPHSPHSSLLGPSLLTPLALGGARWPLFTLDPRPPVVPVLFFFGNVGLERGWRGDGYEGEVGSHRVVGRRTYDGRDVVELIVRGGAVLVVDHRARQGLTQRPLLRYRYQPDCAQTESIEAVGFAEDGERDWRMVRYRHTYRAVEGTVVK